MKKIILVMLVMMTMFTGCGYKEQTKDVHEIVLETIDVEFYENLGVDKIEIYLLNDEIFFKCSYVDSNLVNWVHSHNDIEYTDEEFISLINSLNESNLLDTIEI